MHPVEALCRTNGSLALSNPTIRFALHFRQQLFFVLDTTNQLLYFYGKKNKLIRNIKVLQPFTEMMGY